METEREKAARWLASAERDYQAAVADWSREIRVARRAELVRALGWARVVMWLTAASTTPDLWSGRAR